MTMRTNSRDPLAGFRHESLGDVTSTNSLLLERARAGETGGLWITARRQTGGRGRRGRPWASEPGNLYSSLLLIDPGPPHALGTLPLAVAVAVHDAVRAVLPASAEPLEIKWPNDILIGRKKSAGILLESERLADGRQAVVIGIGVNIAFRPELTQYPVTSLAEQGAAAGPDELFAHLFQAMAELLHLWQGGAGVAAVVARWRQAACGIGEKITVNLPNRSLSGLFAGIDSEGLLLLDTGADKPIAIAAGDVFFG